MQATTTDYISVLKPVAPNIIGNIFNVTSGGTVQRVEVISVSGVTATCDKSLGTAANTCVGNLGGAVGTSATLPALTYALVAGNKVFIKATGTYTLTVTTTITAATKGDTTSGRISIEGYTTYPGQLDGRPIITSATNSVTLFTVNDNDFYEFVHLKLTHTAGTRGNGFTSSTSASTPFWIKDCIFDGCLSATNQNNNWSVMYMDGCEVMNCTSTTIAVGFGPTLFIYSCDIHDNAGAGIIGAQNGGSGTTISMQDCIFDTNLIGINVTNTTTSCNITAHGCVFVDNTGDAIKMAATSSASGVTVELENNVFYGNGGYGIDNLDEQAIADANTRINRNNAFGSNTPSPYTGIAAGTGEITLTADPFVSRAGRNFAPNTTAGGGAAIRAAAYPTTWPSGTTLSYHDVGAAQHQDTGGTSGGFVFGG